MQPYHWDIHDQALCFAYQKKTAPCGGPPIPSNATNPIQCYQCRNGVWSTLTSSHTRVCKMPIVVKTRYNNTDKMRREAAHEIKANMSSSQNKLETRGNQNNHSPRRPREGWTSSHTLPERLEAGVINICIALHSMTPNLKVTMVLCKSHVYRKGKMAVAVQSWL